MNQLIWDRQEKDPSKHVYFLPTKGFKPSKDMPGVSYLLPEDGEGVVLVYISAKAFDPTPILHEDEPNDGVLVELSGVSMYARLRLWVVGYSFKDKRIKRSINRAQWDQSGDDIGDVFQTLRYITQFTSKLNALLWNELGATLG